MSEEILRALMEMFALIVRQDGGMLQGEMDYVSGFLTKQLPHKSADEYMKLFLDNAGPIQEKKIKSKGDTPLVRDSVRILNICSEINKTLTQEQRIVSLIRAFELIDSDKQYTPQRMDIINTIAEVFRVSPEEFDSILIFSREEEREKFTDPSMIVIDAPESILNEQPGPGFIVFLKVPSVNLYFLRCFGNGIAMLNGMPVVNHKIYAFAQGSTVVKPPSTTFYYSDVLSRFTPEAHIHRLTFVADRLTYFFPGGSPAVTDVSFTASEGKLVGIMGASGTGKTTLLNLLCGLAKPVSGDVRVNGRSIFTAGKALDGVIGFVPQDDLLIEELTVSENLSYAAALCFAGKSMAEIRKTVEQLLHTLGLYEMKDLRVGSPLNKVISSGQRKRLNIALEIIREPSILFLDEPTSGLSTRDSENVMNLVHELTLKGNLVITVIHQPSSEIFKGFDRVLILDTEGQMVYYGNPIEAVVHFKTLDAQINKDLGECPTCGTVNSETLFNILETKVIDEFGHYTEKRKVSPGEWAEAFRKNNPVETVAEESSPAHSNLHRPGRLKQFAIFLSRDLRSKLADRQYLLLTLIEGPALGLILSYIIRYIADPSSHEYIFRENENIPIFIFMSVIVALFLGLTISAEEIFRDRKILRREHFLNLSRSSYLLAKIWMLVGISALQTLLFLLVATPILELRGLLPEYWLALFTTAFCANLIGLNISSAFNSPVTIYIVIPILMIPMMVLSGAMFPFDKLNRHIGSVDKVPFVAETMPSRWTYEALMVKQFTGNEYGKRVYDLKKKISQSDFNTTYRIPKIKEALEITTSKVSGGGRLPHKDPKIKLLRSEITRLGHTGILTPFPGLDSLTPELFTLPLGARLTVWIAEAEKEFTRQTNKADVLLDRYISDNKEALSVLYNAYHNDRLEEILRKVYEKNKLLEYRNRLIQNVDLIYLEPDPAGPLSFRTHFMAPVKKFLGITANTYIFNIIIVLLATVFLYIMLYFEVLKKIIVFLGGSDLKKND